MDNLHSRKDEELEERDRKSFARVVLLAGVAMAIYFAIGLLVVWVGSAHLYGINAVRHFTSTAVLVSIGI